MNNRINAALKALKQRMVQRYGDETEIYLFGSVARGTSDEYSDIDVLILIPGEVDISCRERIFDLTFEVGLQYDVVFGVLVYSLQFWGTPRSMVMPIYENILREGISI